MTSPRRFEQDLPALVADLYLARTPDYRDDLVQQIARVQQRPAWTFPERWLPMDIATKALPGAPRVPWRIVGVLALLAALLAAMLAFYTGSQRLPPAPTFGRAANGSLVYVVEGDIYTADSLTGKATAVVVGPETDSRPTWSLDGTRFVFERKLKGDRGAGVLYIADMDGRGLIQVTAEPLRGLSGWSVSPDGRSVVALVNMGRGPEIMITASDGSGQPRFFEVGATADDTAPQFRPDGSEIMFIGHEPGATVRAVLALDPNSGKVRTIIAPSEHADIHGAAWSPDGTRIAYGMYDPRSAQVTSRTHVAFADGTGDIAVDAHPDSIADGGFTWSNDGTRLIIARAYRTARGEVTRSVIVPIDRSSVGVEMECPAGAPSTDCTADLAWAPDDSFILGSRLETTPQFLVDPSTGSIRPAPWTATGTPAMQRRAP